MAKAPPRDWRALGGRVLRPERPRLAEARAVVAGVADPREAWEALAARGLVPMAWVDDPRWVYRARAARDGARWEPYAGYRAEAQAGGRAGTIPCADRDFPVPPTVDAAVALAADPDGLARAGSVAKEVAARLGPWDPLAPPPARLVWRVEGRAYVPGHGRPWRLRRAAALLRAAVGQRPQRTAAYREVYPAAQRAGTEVAVLAACDAGDSELWEQAVARGLTANEGAAGMANRGVPRWAFADLPDPFAALAELWGTGYALDAITDDALVLVAPSV